MMIKITLPPTVAGRVGLGRQVQTEYQKKFSSHKRVAVAALSITSIIDMPCIKVAKGYYKHQM